MVLLCKIKVAYLYLCIIFCHMAWYIGLTLKDCCDIIGIRISGHMEDNQKSSIHFRPKSRNNFIDCRHASGRCTYYNYIFHFAKIPAGIILHSSSYKYSYACTYIFYIILQIFHCCCVHRYINERNAIMNVL